MANNLIPLVSISFKQTLEDIELREWLMKHSNRSGFIKDILREHLEKEKLEKEKLKQLYKN